MFRLRHDKTRSNSDGAQASEYDSGLTRRGFVYATGSVVGLASIGAFAKLISPEAQLLRPPGGQDEDNFIALCTRCDRCRSACPTQVIAPARLEDGLVAVRTPKMNFKLGWCNFCGKCADVCPSGALPVSEADYFEFAGLPDKEFFETTSVVGIAAVNKERCIAWVGPSGCTICSEKCPYEAISLDGQRRPQVDLELCNGCGVCENLCPSSRLHSYQGGQTRGIEVIPRV
jgi:ferredoxin-type protein NapG